ncbi:MAG: hypothetical protein LBI45_01965, partial [Bacteroidales bacterium]|nr:hypothetical protein [Bacteroidales bacterium]
MNLKKNLTLLLSYFLTLLRERRLALFVCFCFALLKTNAQIDKTAILEKLKLEFFPQNQDVNPFQHPREKYIIQCLETQIKNNLSLAVRCDAIVCLAWSLQPDYLPLTLEYGKREALSVPEKLALAGAYTIYGVYTPQHYLREEAVKLLNDVCYYTPSNDKLQHTCIWTYYKLGGDAAKNYYISLLEQKELTERVSVAA